MNTIKRFLTILVAAPFVLAACSGAEAPTDAQAPTSIPPSLNRTSHETGTAAQATLDGLQLGVTASSECWAAVFGSGPNEIFMAASGYDNDAAATAALTRVESAMGKPSDRYKDFAARTIEYEPGFQVRDEKGRYTFVYAKGRWIVTIRTIVQNLPSGVTSVEWVPAVAS